MFWLLVTLLVLTAPPTLGILWRGLNAGLALAWPHQFHRVRLVHRAAPWLYLPHVQARAAELEAMGFVEIGARASWAALSRTTERLFWSPAHQAYATVSIFMVRSRVLLFSHLSNGVVVLTAPRGTPAGNGRLQLVFSHGLGTQAAVDLHIKALSDLLSRDPSLTEVSTGTADDLLALGRTFDAMYLAGGDLEPDLDHVPPALTLDRDHHAVRLHLRPALPRLGFWFPLVALGFCLSLSPVGMGPLGGVLMVLAFLDMGYTLYLQYSHPLWVELGEGRLMVQRRRGLRPLTLPLTERTVVQVQGSQVRVEEDGHRVAFRVGPSPVERHWVAEAVRETALRGGPPEPAGDATDVPEGLARLASRGNRIVV